ncbi:MAG TPA: SUMF1/EgtB/PvdO family nonheme iron enzyme [Burkholderiales bacterium]|nr:SUMF1/EgtB/PvdO family nonheme iron enzyme [Burkholderiales bacterium]
MPALTPDPDATVKIDAEEFARLEAEDRYKAQAEKDERAEREVVDRAWREQEEYTRAVEEMKKKMARRRRAPLIAAAILLAAGVAGALVYGHRAAQERAAQAEALRIAAESLARQEAERAKPAEDPAERARAEAEAKKAEDKAKALALRIEAEARRMAKVAEKKQAEAMARAEERARAQAAANVKEAPRAALRPGSVFQDCADCPRMVVIPAGEFTMGSPASEAERGVDEGPQRQVSIAQPFALGRTEVTVAEFRRFADESGYKTDAERDPRAQGCSGFIYADPAAATPGGPTSWRSPGLTQADSHPVLCVSWNDARAYAQWLSKKTGKRYRLPSEAEWEYAARAGSVTARYWGDDPVQACRFANVADQSRFQTWGFGQKHECTDGHYFTAPAGGYAPNRFGLYDMLGNAWEWTEDCWNASYAGAPADGSAWLSGDCAQRVSRGGSWSTVPRFARSATRNKNAADSRDNLTGFRLARSVE